MKMMTTMISTLALTALTVPALALTPLPMPTIAADFATLDTNADGEVSFTEYKAIALTQGKTVTLAAQEFTRMAQGDAILTEDEFFLADALADQPYALQSLSVTEPMPYEPVETVSTVETFESFPAELEAIEAPDPLEAAPVETKVVAKNLDVPIVMETPNITDETDVLEALDTVTPLEEGTADIDISDMETDIQTEIEDKAIDDAEDGNSDTSSAEIY